MSGFPFRESGETPVFLAPMAGFTDVCFRTLCREQGCTWTVTEMVSAKGLLYGSMKTADLLQTAPQERPVVMQLFGREPERMAEAARRIVDEHGPALAAIDLNFGCPAPKITGNGEGSALMLEPVLCGQIVEAVAAACSVPVSVKIRKGFDHAHENAAEVARICEESGACMVSVHGRTREQRYTGHADWNCVAEVKATVHIPVIGNGDVCSGADAVRFHTLSGCDGLMVGRAALGNPWIFAEIRAALAGEPYAPPDAQTRMRLAIRHAHMTVEAKGPYGVIELRKHLARYISGKREAASLRARLNTAKTLEQIEEILLDTCDAR